jgi:GntR family transcriptional regulator
MAAISHLVYHIQIIGCLSGVLVEDNLPRRTPSLADQVYELVLRGISDGTYPQGSMLPSENQLAEAYQVSRPTIRAAFARLAERGYVKRRRGVGTLVSEAPSIVNPLYQFIDIFERISSRGLTPGFQQIQASLIPADEKKAKILDVPPESDLLSIHKLFTADGHPIIYFKNYIPRHVYSQNLTDEEATQPGITEPFFTFFREICHHPVKYLNSVIRPELSQDLVLDIDLQEAGETLLVIEDIGYDQKDSPVFYSLEYLVNEASSLHVIRQVENS